MREFFLFINYKLQSILQEALEVLRTMGNVVNLLVCRPHDDNFRKLSATNIEVPIPPMRSSFNLKHQQYMNQLEELLPPGVCNFFLSLVIITASFSSSGR
jgi:hypothetical protein